MPEQEEISLPIDKARRTPEPFAEKSNHAAKQIRDTQLLILRGGGHSGKKAKILCHHQKNNLFAILDNSKNILEKRFF